MIIDGKTIADSILKEIKDAVGTLESRKPCLAVLLTGDNPASQIYVSRKLEACREAGILSLKFELPFSISEDELLKKVKELNENPIVDGILVQLPLPAHINPLLINLKIAPEKDVDGFHPFNIGKLLLGHTDGFIPCTPLGIVTILERLNIPINGKNAVILGRSNIVGKPLAALLMQNQPFGNATVTVAHSQTKDLKKVCLGADLIVAAIGKPRFVTGDMVKEGAILIDVGINRIDNPSKPKGYEIVGDADFEALKNKCSFITPVPNGVGPMTIAMLLSNTLKSYLKGVV